ncbi:hypothetical protein MMB232_00728 [Brevundimonas subvibrioides]|uniref:AAA family ATPase n=1 Tax=Brevundimonas subvibrioides TaxID=74313 RepID=UPI0032D591D1
MKFLKLELENIFAYRGRSEIDLSECTPEKNIVIIQGRNGHGKTSLLNAVKLLFLGPGDDRIRRVGFGQTALSVKHFVTGQQGRWFGVFNTIAKESEAPARVALSWSDEKGGVCRAERMFIPLKGGTDFREAVSVTLGHRRLEGDEARQYLQIMLPREVVPFFFFDGEQIQSLADAEIGRERAEIERLLGLHFVAHIARELQDYGQEKRRAGLPTQVQAAIALAEGQEKAAGARAEAEARARIGLEEEIADLDAERARLETERRSLRNGLSEEERKRLEDRIGYIEDERAGVIAKIAGQLPVEAPVLANLALAKQAFDMLEAQIESGADATVSERLHRSVPDAVVGVLTELDPLLAEDEARVVALRAAVSRALASCGVEPGRQDNPLFSSISPRDLRALRDRFVVWNQTGSDTAGRQASRLRKIRQLDHEHHQLVRELEESDITTQEARDRYIELSDQITKLIDDAREKYSEAQTHGTEEAKARREQSEHADRAAREYAKFENVVKQNAAYQLSQQMKRALEHYRSERRRLIRSSVEDRLNERVRLLLGPTQLVKGVRLDDKFAMTYLDDQDEEIGRYSLSAGMRQLAAMSMLWALKDEAKRSAPVMIDTPLGRIDRENREILMTEYFPAAGVPLIVLPTNTEMGEEDFARLQGRIAKRYEIRNDGGVSAKLEELPVSMTTRSGLRG